MGMIGAAVATTAAFFASAIYLYLISRKKVNIVYPKKEIMLITFITAIVFIAGLTSSSFYLDIILIAVYLLVVTRLTKIKLTGLLSIN
jgi:O-antigen/teichoic acid export membrane protein